MLLENIEQIISRAEKLKNKSVQEIINILEENDFKFDNKGDIGHIFESYFGIKKNNRSEPDISHLGVELKASPIIKLKRREEFSPKERMVLNIIDFQKENLDDFYKSSFFTKNQKILMIFYIFVKEINKKNYFFHNIIYHDISKNPFKNYGISLEDLEIIKKDWEIIANKIKEGKAEELSERLTTYLGACPKGDKKINSQVSQPFSNKKAMRRAYSFKTSYLKYLIMKNENPDLLEKLNIDKNETALIFIFKKIIPFVNVSVNDLCKKFNISNQKKDKNYSILKKIFNVKNFDYVEEFLIENIKIRTYTIQINNQIQENFQFTNVSLEEFANPNISFYESELYDYFINTKIIFIGFKKDNLGNSFISKVSSFHFPEKNLKDLEILWNDTKNKFKNGVKVWTKKTKNGEVNCNNLISIRDKKYGYIGHIRPHAQNASKKYKNENSITKQCFWLNKDFISENLVDISKDLTNL